MRVHDNEILSYEIDLKNRKITLHTEYSNKDIHRLIDIVFSDVIAHFFECQLSGSIILDISNYDLNTFFKDKENIELLKKQKNYGWPMDYKTIEELQQELKTRDYLYYVVSSSYGLNGWIIARECNEVQINNS